MKTRLDAELVRRELARSREHAADLIESRSVLVGGIPATKPATQVDAETSITIQGDRDDFVSRGGHKLAGALEVFKDVIETKEYANLETLMFSETKKNR